MLTQKMMYEQEKQVAIAATTAAAKLCMQVRCEKEEKTFEKADRSPVTVADFASQAVVCQGLANAFPDDSVIAEEDASTLTQPAMAETFAQVTRYVQSIIPQATAESVAAWINRGNGEVASRYWTLDPIDGTKGFIRGDQYAIALALIEEGKVKVGVLACPFLPLTPGKLNEERGVIFVAVSGQGTEMMSIEAQQGQPIQVNASREIQMIASVEPGHSDRAKQAAITEALKLTTQTLRMDSQAKYGAVARGEADLYLRIPRPDAALRRENIWDHAAGTLVVEEAGGRVTDLEGKRLDFSLGSKLFKNHGIVASNGEIHEQVLEVWQNIASQP